MVEKFKLKLEARASVKPNQLRRDGKLPATIYGPGVPSESVQVDAKEFSKLPTSAYSHVVELEGPKGNLPVLIRNVQRDHRTTREVLNIEFYRVAADRKLTVTVPLKFVGTSPAVVAGGQFMENFSDCDIECLPNDIPDFIEVDITQIVEVDSGIHFSSVKVPKGVVITNPPEEIVCRVVTRKAEAETPAAAAAAPAASAGAAPAAS